MSNAFKAPLWTRLVLVLPLLIKRKQAQDELKKERDFSSAVIETVGSLVVVLDHEGRIVRFNRYRDHEGQVISLIGISHDITERKRAEEQRTAFAREQQARMDAEEANRVKDELKIRARSSALR